MKKMKEEKDKFQQAYILMDEPVIEGNCGLLCDFHCCRSHERDHRLGMYLLPGEFKAMQGHHADYEVHSRYHYELPDGIKHLHYIFCSDDSGCLRELRPIQCRTYPFEPHLEDGKLYLVVEQEQLHDCPLLKTPEKWRRAFVQGVYKGWQLLLTMDRVRNYVLAASKERLLKDNIQALYDETAIMHWPTREDCH